MLVNLLYCTILYCFCPLAGKNGFSRLLEVKFINQIKSNQIRLRSSYIYAQARPKYSNDENIKFYNFSMADKVNNRGSNASRIKKEKGSIYIVVEEDTEESEEEGLVETTEDSGSTSGRTRVEVDRV